MSELKPLEIQDRDAVSALIEQDPPVISELTFTNLFMWRNRNHPIWREAHGCGLVIFQPEDAEPFGLPPFGGGDKRKALEALCEELSEMTSDVTVARADKNFVDQTVTPDLYETVEDRDNSDYVYLAEDLINLSGNKYHGKKNHLNKFVKNYDFTYEQLKPSLVEEFLSLQQDWCDIKNCLERPGLYHEDEAISEALRNFEVLDFRGGAILIDGSVEAFSLGERLNPQTAVIHVEKANPDIPELYAVINQRFCEAEWSDCTYVNREQDLGIQGLRKAKKSYHPDHMVEKFTIRPKT